ncbi:hypothetical protein [Acetobacter oeni]|uniref:DNA adenine methylase n=1 Tax=Acetobacter oeni TaxID=304077 RepID=A0A511XLW3_9PROT|nr:hypothetical protein [Acetobacter oeni]MBB3882959.1 hypothetical protein [Acetobacter oeni]GBR09263.1 hypothetical protein AA21952_2808 [Acetobacter oeni LMG 21952]GEN63921.1 hypothetical protein AOE01nite_21450 [Acetobacter oeni]
MTTGELSRQDYYNVPFSRDDFKVLAGLLRSLRGGFIMSINDRPEIRSVLAGYEMVSMPTRWNTGGGSGSRAYSINAEHRLLKRFQLCPD